MMTDQLKKEIISEALAYMSSKDISQNKLCEASKINVGYLSYMLKGEIAINGTVIADKWFAQLAAFIGFTIEKTYWEVAPTPQFLSLIASLQEAKNYPRAFILIGTTGSGKTFATDKFVTQHPTYTFRITAGSHYRLADILNEICSLANVETNGNTFDRVLRLSKKMHDIKRSGGKPVIIIDEAENLKIPVIQLLKSIFDRVIDSCSIVLIGTPELIEKINKGCAKGISGMPQFLRRFKAGIRYLPVIDVSFDLMLDKYKLERGLLKLIRSLATNYGELRDYLEPVMREADLRNEKLTEDFFRMYHDIPKKEGFRS